MAANPLVEALEAAVQQARDMDAPLNERLGLIADTVRSLSATFAETVDRLVRRLQESGAGETTPAPGEPMPPFMLPDDQGHLVNLERLLVDGPVVVSFNRGHWCPYCRINLVALGEIEAELRNAGAQLVAITPERRRFTQAWRAEAATPFPILTDMDNGYALSLNLAIWVGQEMERMIAAAGWDVPSYQGNAAWMLPIPATFVIGTDGLVTARDVDPDYRRRMEVDALLDAVRKAR